MYPVEESAIQGRMNALTCYNKYVTYARSCDITMLTLATVSRLDVLGSPWCTMHASSSGSIARYAALVAMP